MTKVEAIKKVLEDHKGIATWKIIYDEIEKYYPYAKRAETWESGLRGVAYREIYNNKFFKQIGLDKGMIALLDYQEEKIEGIKQDAVRMHSYMEGICIEIGNFLKLKTFTADPTATYKTLTLSDISTLPVLPQFTYPEIINTTKRIDVLWFNEKGFQYPKRAIEVVDSIGTLEPALKRSLQLIEFNLSFYILCKNEHIKKVEKELSCEPYIRIKDRYKIRDYESILNIYNNPIAHSRDEFLSVKTYF
ncbi:MAG: hypothetical protein LBU73_09040 [Helicobacteraceae bacterium]|jgi:hypothetical protein|nr:hypothetical protein [Helicobacteraceae bacterium]